MATFLLSACGGLLVFLASQFLKFRLSLLGYLGAGALAALVAWILLELVLDSDPVVLTTRWVVVPVVSLVIGALLVALLLKAVRRLR